MKKLLLDSGIKTAFSYYNEFTNNVMDYQWAFHLLQY